MALSRTTIQFNFDKAAQQADELDDIAENLSRLTNSDFAVTMQSISANWKGENANKYLEKGAKVQENMYDTANSIRNAANEIRRIAKRIYDAEMEALRIAEERHY